ncbi:MAG TPA: SDR family oxidoreductase [Myxococcales bacterium]|jgi:NAD(P)-dependent dehydrogenase (short-subunit alcohol dehydrogenase family)|nr:SDR family oxidoreductase [Myxococcales bacterium]
MRELAGKVAVITGAGSGFGLEFARIGARERMKLVLADVQQDALDAAVGEARDAGADAIGVRIDVSSAAEVDRLASRTVESFGGVHLLFNNAGVAGGGGYAWEASLEDWQWVLGVNLMGVVHGIRSFVPRMLRQSCECHVVNTASAAGLVSAPLMGVYNVSKHGVVALSETLFHDLRAAGAKVSVSVLCPAFVPTNIHASERNRPPSLAEAAPPTPSQIAARERSGKAVASGRLTAAEVARMTFEAVREDRFYVVTHPKMLASVELRLQDIVTRRNPTDPYTFKPELKAR